MTKKKRSWGHALFPSRAVLRVTAYAVFAFSLMAVLAARVLLADVEEAALAAGHQLAGLADLARGAETIELNGERMHHASTYTELDVGVVLDRFEGHCASAPGFLGRAMTDFPKELAGRIERAVPSRTARLGIVRDEADGRGMVACFVSDRPAGFDALKERLERFFATLRLGEFGQFRYAFAEKTKAGGTHVVVTWADGALDLRAMFPAEGDAAGSDSIVLPRPPNARRTLSAGAMGMPYGLRSYASRESAASIASYYGHWMAEHGFEAAPGGEHQGTSAYLRHDGYQAFVTIGEEHGTTSVTLLEAGRTDVSPTAVVEATAE